MMLLSRGHRLSLSRAVSPPVYRHYSVARLSKLRLACSVSQSTPGSLFRPGSRSWSVRAELNEKGSSTYMAFKWSSQAISGKGPKIDPLRCL